MAFSVPYSGSGPLLPFVLLAGLLDSLNPCAIAVLLIFIALMFTLRKSRLEMTAITGVYIGAVFLTYLAIGLGLLQVINFFGIPHLVSKIGALIVILIGLWGLKESFWPGKFRLLSISLGSRQLVAHWATKATIPAAIVAGFLVGVAEFPCSGAIYVATLSLLAGRETFLMGLLYLILYNLMFVLPLIIIYAITTNRMVAEKLLALDEANSNRLRFITSIIMLGIGAAIFIWFV